MEVNNLLVQVASILVAAGAVYGGIRVDLKNIHRRQDKFDEALEKARDRIDDCMACAGRRKTDKAA